MERIKLKSVRFKNLKGLSEVTLHFSDTLTAIMGVNGAGKSTVIHALACLYKPDGNGENHKFPEFFVPNTDSLWKGSELYATNEVIEGKSDEWKVLEPRKYSKDYDRWSPRYENRPKRNVYYLGIDTCLPDIEKSNATCRIMYRTNILHDANSDKIIDLASYILNKDYEFLLENEYNDKSFLGVKRLNGLKYSTLSMGSGEQRVIKILSTLQNAEKYSLILIDEIDLLLHVSALHRIIEKLYQIAKEKHIQIVFTTHSLEMIKLEKYVSIQYISNITEGLPSQVYEKITPELVHSLTGMTYKPYKIYVEDDLAKEIVNQIVRKKSMSSSVDVITYGSIENAFTLAAGVVLQGLDLDKRLIVLDGDRYCSAGEREKQIGKKLSGTGEAADNRRSQALGIITEFILPQDYTPEKYLHETIMRCLPRNSEIFTAAQEIKAVDDSHDWIGEICNKLDTEVGYVIREIFDNARTDSSFEQYISNIEKWLSNITY